MALPWWSSGKILHSQFRGPGFKPCSCLNQRASMLQKKKKKMLHNKQIIFKVSAAAAAKALQSCPTLCDPIDGSPPGSPVPGTLQVRTLEWVAISFSNGDK